MAKKKKSPETVLVAEIKWHDAAIRFREKLDASPTLNRTVGYVVYEDAQLVALAHEITVGEDWLNDVMDYTKIPQAMIVSRKDFGETRVNDGDDDAETKSV